MTKQNARNNVIQSIQARPSSIAQAPSKPLNARMGGTGGGPNNYGQGRSGPVTGSYAPAHLMGWKAGWGTSQDRYAKTRLPGEY